MGIRRRDVKRSGWMGRPTSAFPMDVRVAHKLRRVDGEVVKRDRSILTDFCRHSTALSRSPSFFRRQLSMRCMCGRGYSHGCAYTEGTSW